MRKHSPKSWKCPILSSHCEQLFPWGANLSSNLVSGSCYVTASHQFQGTRLNSFGCQQNPRQNFCFYWQGWSIYSLNELPMLLNSREAIHFNLRWIKILNFWIHFSAWDRYPSFSLSSMCWFFFTFCFSRPGLLNTGDPSYPWLADSWPATSLPVNNSSSGPNEIGNFGRGGKLGFSKFLFCYLLFSGFSRCFKNDIKISSIIKISEAHIVTMWYSCWLFYYNTIVSILHWV